MGGPPHDHIAVLAEPPVYVGVAALANSLVRNGFVGTIWLGYRGTPPAFAAGREAIAVTPDCTLRLLELDTDRPLTYYKAEFVEALWRDHCPDAASICYFDTDIVIHRSWSFFRAWLCHGVALCEDHPYWPAAEDSPLRHAWADLMSLVGVEPIRSTGKYFNAGFVGIPREEQSFLGPWRELTSAAERSGIQSAAQHCVTGELDDRVIDLPPHVADILRFYFSNDQDGLNMAVMACANRICSLGPDGMGFTPSFNFAMVHPVGPYKPWNKHFLGHVLRRGAGPTSADVVWWKYADGPIAVFPPRRVVRARVSIAGAKVMGRLVGSG